MKSTPVCVRDQGHCAHPLSITHIAPGGHMQGLKHCIARLVPSTFSLSTDVVLCIQEHVPPPVLIHTTDQLPSRYALLITYAVTLYPFSHTHTLYKHAAGTIKLTSCALSIAWLWVTAIQCIMADPLSLCSVQGYWQGSVVLVTHSPTHSSATQFWRTVLDKKCTTIIAISQSNKVCGDTVC